MAETARAMAWLTRYQPLADLHFQMHLRCDPPFAPLENDPRFRQMLLAPRPPAGTGC